ncbi:MAG: IclR family transcriptional regulator [Victivallaceae bacterium]|nr:IclR family transcriptional regulator [Victivallaceae bacterium]
MIQSLERAFKILELMNTLECAQKGMGGLEISKKLGLKHPTVHNFLKSLVELGYIEQNPETSKFRLAAKTRELGMNMMLSKSLAICAQPHLQALTGQTDETSILILLDNDLRHTILIEECKKPYRIAVSSTIDRNFYNTATGRVLLANMGDEELSAFLRRVPPAFGDSGIPSDEIEMLKIIRDIRSRGYECIIKKEITVIGAPLVNRSSGLNAAIGIYFPTNGRTREEIQELVRKTQNTANNIAQIIKIH